MEVFIENGMFSYWCTDTICDCDYVCDARLAPKWLCVVSQAKSGQIQVKKKKSDKQNKKEEETLVRNSNSNVRVEIKDSVSLCSHINPTGP